MADYIAYTDGSSIGNSAEHPGPAGFAAKFLDGSLYVGSFPGTNNEAEMAAICLAVSKCPPRARLEIRTDSAISLSLLAGRRRTDKATLRNLQCYFDELCIKKNILVDFVKVKGHSHEVYNDIVDSAAKNEARAYRTRAPWWRQED